MTTPPQREDTDQAECPEDRPHSIQSEDRLPQLRLTEIAAIWCAAALPMPLLAFVVAPALSARTAMGPGIALIICMLAGLVWQTIIALLLLKRERLNSAVRKDWRKQIWWQSPTDPNTRRRRRMLLLLVIPIIAATYAIEESGVSDLLAEPLLWLVPWLADLPSLDIRELADARLQGAWWLVPLMLVLCLFNYALGEALLFHGVLMPRMEGAFGKWDWVWNGILFGGYHLIRPLTIPSIIVTGAIWAYFSIRYRSSQVAIITHAVDGLFVMGLTISVVTGILP